VTSADTVKVVTDEHDYALLFSREPVPKRCPMNSYDATVRYKIRVGIQACRCDFLEKYATLKGKTSLRDKENKSPPRWKNGKVIVDPDEPEQNRVVFAGHRVKVDVVEDYVRAGGEDAGGFKATQRGAGHGARQRLGAYIFSCVGSTLQSNADTIRFSLSISLS
jgi:CMP-2-keto-3-deoxyoctulosonic acid synthetase